MDLDPVDVALADVAPREPAVRTIELEVLQVNLRDAGAERPDPVLREAVEHHVADVEVGLEPGRVELVDVAGELHGAQEEFVPDLLDRDDHLQLARHRQQALANHALRSRQASRYEVVGVDDGRDQQDGVGAPQRRVAQRGFHPCTLRSTTSRSPLDSGSRQ